MLTRTYIATAGLMLLFAGMLSGQPSESVKGPAASDLPVPPKDQIAATVNGQAIPELAVYRGLLRVPKERQEAARKDVLNFLIDNTIVDQYLVQLKIQIEPKEVQEHVEKMRNEAKDSKQDFDATLRRLQITETELRLELVSALRWDKFVLQQGTEKALRELFDKNTQMFDGSRVKARHILRPIEDGKKDTVLSQVASLKQEIEAAAAQAMSKLPADADAITREKTRASALDKAFADAAIKHSSCPSKEDGGDLGYFPRAGAMVEPFARAAFALKPYQMSEPVATEFGYHLILATDTKPGKQVTFEQVKSFVQEVYGERLREAILTHYKSKSKIEIVPTKK